MERTASRAALTSGVALAALLTLSACGNPFAADEEDAEGGGEAGPPTFEALQEQLWDTMLSAESVTIEGEVEAGEAELDELFDGIDEDERGEIALTGALDGTHSEMTYTAGEGHSFAQRAVDGVEYFRGEDFAELFHSGLDEEIAEAVDEDFIDDLIADQWVQIAEDGGAVFSAEDFLRTWQRELDGEDVAGITAEEDTREGEPVWVYSDEEGETEYVVAAEGDPVLFELRDEESHYTFGEWDAAELPEEPENVLTTDDIFDAIAEDQGWPTEDLDEEGLDDEADDEDGGDAEGDEDEG